MTESVLGSIQFRLALGCYGSCALEIPSRDSEGALPSYGHCLGSTALPPGWYPTLSAQQSPSAALHAMACRLEEWFGNDQVVALRDFQSGKFTLKQCLAQYGTAVGREFSAGL